METVAKRFELHLVDDLVDKGILQEQLSLSERDATLAHIEEGRIVELSYRRAMGTLHVVGIDLEHRLGVHSCLFRGRQVLVGHLRDGLLGAVLHEHTPCESTYGLIVEHILIEFVRRAVRHAMGNQRVIIDMLLFVGNHATVAMTLSSLAREGQVELIAGDAVMQRDDIMIDTTVSLLVDIHIAHAYILIMGLLQTIEVERGIIAHVGLDDLCGEEVAIVSRMVAEEHLDLSPLLENDEHTTVHHQIGYDALGILRCRLQDVDDLNGAIDLDVTRHIDEHAVLSQHRVERRHSIVAGLGQLGIILGSKLWIRPHRTYNHPFWEMTFGLHLRIEGIVDHEVE